MASNHIFGSSLMILFLLLGACSGGGAARTDDDDGGSGDSDTGGDSESGSGGDSDSATTADGCSEESKLIYVVDVENGLYRFDPPAKTFTFVGTIDCPGSGTPYALAVSRTDTVYILFQSASECAGIREVNTLDASCIGPTAFPCGQNGFELFGMGAATDGAGSTTDMLYIGSTNKLARVDTTTWELTVLGAVQNLPDLSGNSLGELWGYLAWTNPPRVSRFDTTDATELETIPLPALAGGGSFAFADWGGDFYLFVDEGAGSSDVHLLHDGTLTTYMENVGFEIVGADSSTCAPVVVE